MGKNEAVASKAPTTARNDGNGKGNGKTLEETEYFKRLGEAIEEAGFNIEIKKRRLETHTGPIGAIEEYLGTEVCDFMVSEYEYTAPLAYVYLANLQPYVLSRYTDRTADAVRKARSTLRNISGLDGELSTFGIRQSNLLMMGDGSVREMFKRGFMFLEDANGERMVVRCEQTRSNPGQDAYAIKFYHDRRKDFSERAADFLSGLERYCRENPVFGKGVFTMHGRAIRVEPTAWEALKVSGEAMRLINFHIVDFIRRMGDFKARGARTSRGIILCGPPGNGKTLLGRILAGSLDLPFLWVTAKDVERAENIERLYRFAAFIAPCVVFIEDADLFMQNRQSALGTMGLTLSEFLNRLDGLRENRGVITVITANNPEFMDEAVKNRPRRFDARIVFDNPDERRRREILEYRLRDVSPDEEGLLELAAERLKGVSCAHVSEFAERLKLAMVYNERGVIDREIVEAELEGFDTPVRPRKAGFTGSAVS